METKIKELMDKYGFTEEFMEEVIQNTVLMGESIISIYDWEAQPDGSKIGKLSKAKILNKFKGCGCGN